MDNNVIDQNMQPQASGLQPIVPNDNNYQQPVVDNNQAVMPSQPLAPPPVEPVVEQVSNQLVMPEQMVQPVQQMAPPPVMDNTIVAAPVAPEVVMQVPVAPVEQIMPQQVMPEQVVQRVQQMAPPPMAQPVVEQPVQPMMPTEQVQPQPVVEAQPVMPQQIIPEQQVQPVMQDVQVQMQQDMSQQIMPQQPVMETQPVMAQPVIDNTQMMAPEQPVMQDVQVQMQQAMVVEPVGQPVMPQEPVMQDVQMQMQQAMNPQIIQQMPQVQLMDTPAQPTNVPEQEFINNVPVYPGQTAEQPAPVLIDTVEEETPETKKFKPKKKKKNNSTLAIIIGVILLVGVGVISLKFLNFDALDNYADTEKKSEFVNASLSYMNHAITKIHESGLDTLKNDTLIIFIPVGNDEDKSCVILDNGGKSPFDDSWKMAYVAAVYNSDNDAYDYYFTGIDGANYGIKLSGEEKIKKEAEILVESDVDDYAIKLQEIYASGESYAISPIADYEDDDITEFAEMVGAEKAIVLSKDNCK